MKKYLEIFEERKLNYQKKIIELMKRGLNLNQIALEIERTEGETFSKATYMVAINELMKEEKPQSSGPNRCFNCNGPVSILADKCPVCNT